MPQEVTKPISLDETLQATNTALGLLGKDTTLQSIVTALASIGVNTVGNLASLVTADKSSLVGAVNEVAGDKISKSQTAGLVKNDGSIDTESYTDEIGAIVNVYGGKNLWDFDTYLKNSNPTSGYTKNGNSYTVNVYQELDQIVYQFSEDDIDGIFTVTLSTTESSDTPQPAFWIYNKNDTLISAVNLPEQLPSNTPYEWSQSFNGGCKIVLRQYAGTGNLTFTSPMLRDARISDPTYAPYAMTNRELTEGKQNKTLDTPLTVAGTPQTTVENALSSLNDYKITGSYVDAYKVCTMDFKSDNGHQYSLYIHVISGKLILYIDGVEACAWTHD